MYRITWVEGSHYYASQYPKDFESKEDLQREINIIRTLAPSYSEGKGCNKMFIEVKEVGFMKFDVYKDKQIMVDDFINRLNPFSEYYSTSFQ